MPRNLSAVIDAILFLVVTAALAGTIFIYNTFLGLASGLLWFVIRRLSIQIWRPSGGIAMSGFLLCIFESSKKARLL